ncbi:MAG: hypothetical protein ACFCBU_07760 [Cyanophyceae cyanobacterium]
MLKLLLNVGLGAILRNGELSRCGTQAVITVALPSGDRQKR